MNDQNVAFLFGSGISINAGLPSSETIMSELLAGKVTFPLAVTNQDEDKFIFHTGDEQYLIGKLPNNGLLVDERILMFLRSLRQEADNYFYGRRPANYEDVFYMVWQIVGSRSGHVDNPAANLLIRQLDKEFSSLYGHAKEETQTERDYFPKQNRENRLCIANIGQLAQKTYNYVQRYLYAALGIPNPRLDAFAWVKDAIDDSRYSRKLFFTLNNDLLLETFFSSENIDYTDGFSPAPATDARRSWDGDGLDSAKAPLLAKLHGSINWFFSDRGIVSTSIHDRSRDLALKGPIVLIGRDNKQKEYCKPLFQELHSQFYCRLKELNRLIVCGYGFRDDAVNMRLATWLLARQNRLVLVHPDPDACVAACPYIAKQLHRCEWQFGKVERRMEKVKWAQIMDQMNCKVAVSGRTMTQEKAPAEP
jgi:hypothetical protein